MRTRTEIPADPIRRRCRRALQDHRRRARADGQTLDYTAEDLERLVREAPVCPYCKNVIVPAAVTFDHLVPTARGGRHLLANLTPCCQPCNERKGQLSADEYRALMALVKKFHPRAFADVMGRLRSGGARYARGRSRKGATP